MPLSRVSGFLSNLSVAFAFLVLTLVFTYPLCFHITTLLLGVDGDNVMWLGWFGWYREAFANGYPLLNDIQQFYPHGVNLLVYLNGFSLDAIFALPVILTGQYILAYNLLSILSIWLSAVSAYFMCYDLVKSRTSAIFGGITFGFGAFQMAQALGHFSIFGPFWLPLLVMSLNRLLKKPSAELALLAGIFGVLTCLTNGYAAIVTIFVYFFYAAFWVAPRIVQLIKKNELMLAIKSNLNLLLGFGCPMLGLLIVLGALRLPNPPPWNPVEYASWGASPFDYLLPSLLHPVFGPLLLKFYSNFPFSPFRWGNFVERDLYLGITPLFLAFYAVIVKRDLVSMKFALVAIGFVILSLGPFLKVFGLPYNVEPYSLLLWLPFFRAARVIARLGVGALLFVSLISAIGMNYLLNTKILRPRARSQLVASILIGLLLFEIVPTIPYPLTNPAHHSSNVYVWLSNQPGKFGILEYPVTSGDTEAGYHMLIAMQYTTSGFVNIAPADLTAYLASISFLQPNDNGELRPVNVTLLKTLNIRYILIHESNYLAKYGRVTLSQALAEANSTVGLRYIAVIDDTAIYEVTQPGSSPSITSSTERIFAMHLAMLDQPGYKDWFIQPS
jgi:hypothetical protein